MKICYILFSWGCLISCIVAIQHIFVLIQVKSQFKEITKNVQCKNLVKVKYNCTEENTGTCCVCTENVSGKVCCRPCKVCKERIEERGCNEAQLNLEREKYFWSLYIGSSIALVLGILSTIVLIVLFFYFGCNCKYTSLPQ